MRRIRHFIADLFDKIREPGWPRRIAFVVVVALIMLIPYPLSITGDFEVISLRPLQVRNKVEGTLTEIMVNMGEQVKEGKVVARLLDVDQERDDLALLHLFTHVDPDLGERALHLVADLERP